VRVLALGWAVGIALVLASFSLTAALGIRGALWAHPVVVVAIAFPWARRNALAIAWDEGPPARAVAAGAGVIAVALAYLAVGPFVAAPLPEHAASVEYYADNVFDIGLVGEAMHHWLPDNPSVAGRPLRYHLLAFLDMAATANVAGAEPSTLVLRLFPVTMTVLAALLMACLGRRLTGRWAAGVLAAALLFVAGEVDLFPRVRFPFAGSFASVTWASPTYMFGLPLFLAATLLVCDAIGQRRRPAAGVWVLIALLTTAAAGAKASAAPVLLGGLVLTAGWCVLRDRARAPLLAGLAALVLGVYAIAYVVLYSGGSEVLDLHAFDFLRITQAWIRIPAVQTDVALQALLSLPTLLAAYFGVIGIAWFGWRRSGGIEVVFLLALLLASLLPSLIVRSPGVGQLYFLLYGVPPALAVAAAGLVRFWDRAIERGVRPRRLVGAALAVLAVAAAGAAYAWTYNDISSITPVLRAYLVVAIAIVVAAVVVAPSPRRLGVVAGLAVALAVPVTLADRPLDDFPARLKALKDGVPMNPVDQPDARGTTRELTDGLRWVRDNTPTDALFAVNVHLRTRAADSRYFYFSALTERRMYLESWAYTPEGAARPAPLDPFPEQHVVNDRAVIAGSQADLDRLRERGVDYILVDRIHGTGSPALDDEAERVFSNDALLVYRLRG
jgi:preprotein translocase subunit Sec61beta